MKMYRAITSQGLEEEDTGTYQRNGINLSIIFENEPATFEIVNINAQNLHLKLTEERTTGGVRYKEEIEQKFIKM